MLRRVVVAGATGLIGSALVESLRADGVEVTRLVRRSPRAADEVEWMTTAASLDPAVLEGADAVVGLNGASIGRFPWTNGYKRTLVSSRVEPTRALARALRELGADAPAFVSASAVGYYGARPRGTQTEGSPGGASFLAELCDEWESAAREAGPHVRVTLLRTAPVVHPGGVLSPLILLTRLGVSGPIGPGTQIWPWISLDDAIGGIRHVIEHEVDGPVNLTGPTPAHANDLGFALAVRLNRPYLVRAPAWALRLALGSDATEDLLLTDSDVRPRVLEETGFDFAQSTVEEAVAAALPQR